MQDSSKNQNKEPSEEIAKREKGLKDIEEELDSLVEKNAEEKEGQNLSGNKDKEEKEKHADSTEETRVRPVKKGLILSRFRKRKIIKKEPDMKKGDELIKIYQENGEEKLDMSKLERKKRSKKTLALLAIIFLLTVVLGLSILSWLIFYRTAPKFEGKNIKFEVKTAEDIQSGQEINYLINYANFEAVPLGKVQINLRYPEGFQFSEAVPLPNEGNEIWNVGSLDVGETGKIEIKGKLIGEINSNKILSAEMNYWPSNFNSEFQEVASAETKISSTLLGMTIEGPAHALVGENISYLIKVKNTSENELQNVKVSAIYPENFTVESTEPESKIDLDNEWTFDKLTAEEEKKIKINGSFNASSQQEQKIEAKVSLSVNEIYYNQAEDSFSTQVIMGDLSSDLIINGSSKDTTADFDDTLNYSINYKNNTENDLEDIVIQCFISSIKNKGTVSEYGTGVIDWTSLKDSNKGKLAAENKNPQIAGLLETQSITWDKSKIKGLAKLTKGQDGSIDFSIDVKDLYSAQESLKLDSLSNLEIDSYISITIGKAAGIVSDKKIETSHLIVKLNTDLLLVAEGRYHDKSGAVIGSGPLPPKVGQKTTYKINWNLANSLHEVSDIIISATLPDNVIWENRTEISAGEITFNDNTKTVTWKVNRFPLTIAELLAQFEISIIPTSKDAGKVITLLPKITLTAVDIETQGKITIIAGPITTALTNDEGAKGKEVVTE